MRTSLAPLIVGTCIWTTATSAQAQFFETRRPVISRMQVLYSVVAHHNSIADRVVFYDSFGNPAGNANYAVPHLVYEPIVTLYNPYNTVLSLSQSRIRLVNPPVGFRFKKNADYLRSEWNNGGSFHGLGRFQIANENNNLVQKTITLSLGGGDATSFSGPIVLEPGESRTFSLRVESNWTWGLETANGYPGRQFFDWDVSADLTNRDRRTNNAFGAEAVAGVDFRAGFQTDCLSVVNGSRPAATRYPFETGSYHGNSSFAVIKLTDTVVVEGKGVRTRPYSPSAPDFQLSLLGGWFTDTAADTQKSYSFNIADLVQAQTENTDTPTVGGTYKISDILQTAEDPTPGGKTPFANFVLAARSTALQQRKFQSATQPPANELYEVRLDPVTGFTDPTIHEGPSDHPVSGVVVIGSERVGDRFMLDVAAAPLLAYAGWKVMGTSDLAAGFTDDLTAGTVFREGPADTGLYKVSIPVPAESDRYFVRIEY